MTSGEPAVPVRVVADAGAFELLLQLGLRSIDNDEVWFQRKDALQVRIEERAHALEFGDLRRVTIEAANRHDLWARANGEQHLGDRGNDRDDPCGALRTGPWRDQIQQGHDGNDGHRNSNSCVPHRRFSSSHRKNGPPISVVMTPTGISTGAITVRARPSQATRNAAPKSAAAGSTTR